MNRWNECCVMDGWFEGVQDVGSKSRRWNLASGCRQCEVFVGQAAEVEIDTGGRCQRASDIMLSSTSELRFGATCIQSSLTELAPVVSFSLTTILNTLRHPFQQWRHIACELLAPRSTT